MSAEFETILEAAKALDEHEVADLLALDRILVHGLSKISESALRDWYNLDDRPYSVFEHIKHPFRSFF